jgi:hypothetical protein
MVTKKHFVRPHLKGRRLPYPTDKQSLRGRYRPLTAALAHKLVCWSHRDFSW